VRDLEKDLRLVWWSYRQMPCHVEALKSDQPQAAASGSRLTRGASRRHVLPRPASSARPPITELDTTHRRYSAPRQEALSISRSATKARRCRLQTARPRPVSRPSTGRGCKCHETRGVVGGHSHGLGGQSWAGNRGRAEVVWLPDADASAPSILPALQICKAPAGGTLQVSGGSSVGDSCSSFGESTAYRFRPSASPGNFYGARTLWRSCRLFLQTVGLHGSFSGLAPHGRHAWKRRGLG
jgi:hypothetical protein